MKYCIANTNMAYLVFNSEQEAVDYAKEFLNYFPDNTLVIGKVVAEINGNETVVRYVED